MTTEVKASHILVQTQEEALNLLNEIKMVILSQNLLHNILFVRQDIMVVI